MGAGTAVGSGVAAGPTTSVGAGVAAAAGVGVGVGETATAGGSVVPSPPPPPSTPTPNRMPTSAPTTAAEPSSHFQLVAIPIYATSNIQRMIYSLNSAGPCSE